MGGTPFEGARPNHINLYIQSPGGSLLPTLALVDEIKNLDNDQEK